MYGTFGTSAMLRCIQKSIKKQSNIHQKCLSNQHPNLHRFWNQLGSILGRFWGPRWSQLSSKWLQKSIQKTIQKMITFCIASRSIFDRFLAPTWPPRGETTIQIWSISRSWGPLGPKISPRPLQEASWDPQDPSKRPLGSDFIRFWPPTWWFLEQT